MMTVSVKPRDVSQLVVGATWTPDGLGISDGEFGHCRLREWMHGVCGAGVDWVDTSFVECRVIDNEADTRWKDDIVTACVQSSRLAGGGYGDYGMSAVFLGPDRCGVLEHGSDTFTAVERLYCKALDDGYRFCQPLGVVRACVRDDLWVVAVLVSWTDKDGTHKAILHPCPKDFVVQTSMPLDRWLWDGNVTWIRDVFGEYASGGLIITHGIDGADLDAVVSEDSGDVHDSSSKASGFWGLRGRFGCAMKAFLTAPSFTHFVAHAHGLRETKVF